MSELSPADGSLVVVIDESSPSDGAGGVAYALVAAALIAPVDLAATLLSTTRGDRQRPFHWAREGPQARQRMIDLVIDEGIVAQVLCAHVGRRGQVAARRRMIAELSVWASAEGATLVIIEAGDSATDGRDKATLLDVYREAGGVPFLYEWRTKNEPLLWIADAIAGAVGEHLSGKDSSWFLQLCEGKVLNVRYH